MLELRRSPPPVGGDADGDSDDVMPGDTLEEDLAGLLPPPARSGRCAVAVSEGGGGTRAVAAAAAAAGALDGGGGGGGGGMAPGGGGTLWWWCINDGGEGGSTGAVVGDVTMSGGTMSDRCCRLWTDKVASQFWNGAGVWYSAGSDGGRKGPNGLIGKKAWPGESSGIAADPM